MVGHWVIIDLNAALGFILTFPYSQPSGDMLLESGFINAHYVICLFKQVKFGPLIWQVHLWDNSFYLRTCWPCISIIGRVALLSIGNTIYSWKQLLVFIEWNDFISVLQFFYLTLVFILYLLVMTLSIFGRAVLNFFSGSYLRQTNIFKASYKYFNVLFRVCCRKKICEPNYTGKGSLPFFFYSYISLVSPNLGQE